MIRTSFLILVVIACAGAWAAAHVRAAPMALQTPTEPHPETLLDAPVTTPPPGVPTVGVLRWTLRPSGPPLVVPAPEGPLFMLVESGHLTAAQNGRETPLTPGETLVPADQEHEIALQVGGAEDVIVLIVSLAQAHSDPICYTSRNPQFHTADVLIRAPAGALPTTSGHLVLERLTLPAGTSLAPYAANPFVWSGVASGVLGLTLSGQMPLMWEPGQERALRPGQPWPQLPGPAANPLVVGGTQMMLRNAGPERLVLYRLILQPQGQT